MPYLTVCSPGMSGLIRGAWRAVGFGSNDAHKLPKQPEVTLVEMLVEQVAHPAAFKFGPGKEPVWNPKEYRFGIPKGPTGFARVRHYWHAHWRAVAKQFLEPITNFYAFIQRARSLLQPKKRVAQAFNSHVAKKPENKLEDKAEEGYGGVLARALEKHFLHGQKEACRLLGLIIIRPVLHSLEEIAASQLAYGAVDPELLEERLNSLLPGLTKTMHLIHFPCTDWREYGHKNFEAKYGRDPLAFRERELCFIADYLSTMFPIAFELCKKGKDQGFLREVLEKKKLLPTMTIGRRLVKCLPYTALR